MMNFTSKLLKGSKPAALRRMTPATATVRPFSLLQNELEKHDFSDPLNVEELKLKHPT